MQYRSADKVTGEHKKHHDSLMVDAGEEIESSREQTGRSGFPKVNKDNGSDMGH